VDSAETLADPAEVDARRLHRAAAYPSMFARCVGVLHLSEDAAYKRIEAARAARRCPAIFPALAEGRLHLSAVVLLAPHLAEETADELLAAATHRTRAALEQWLAGRFPRPDLLTRVETLPASPAESTDEQAPGPVGLGPPPAPAEVLEARPPAPEEVRGGRARGLSRLVRG
jgi:hypothetical protein